MASPPTEMTDIKNLRPSDYPYPQLNKAAGGDCPSATCSPSYESMNSLHQHEHEAINAREYPGTRQLCATCDEPTERCEEDAIYTEDGEGPLCPDCHHKTPEYIQENAVLRRADNAPES